MRIISGYARGLRLKSPPDQAIRPTSDRAREALFNIINHLIQDASVLDLFAGSGTFGLEALSRGARHSTFVDNSPNAITLIKKNLQLLQRTFTHESVEPAHPEGASLNSFLKQVSVIKYDLRQEAFFKRNERLRFFPYFDVIFLDPPYAKGLSLQVLTKLDKNDFLTEQGILIAEERANVELPDCLTTLTRVDKRKYGDTVFWFYKRH